jgi:hypothetical protein
MGEGADCANFKLFYLNLTAMGRNSTNKYLNLNVVTKQIFSLFSP